MIEIPDHEIIGAMALLHIHLSKLSIPFSVGVQSGDKIKVHVRKKYLKKVEDKLSELGYKYSIPHAHLIPQVHPDVLIDIDIESLPKSLNTP